MEIDLARVAERRGHGSAEVNGRIVPFTFMENARALSMLSHAIKVHNEAERLSDQECMDLNGMARTDVMATAHEMISLVMEVMCSRGNVFGELDIDRVSDITHNPDGTVSGTLSSNTGVWIVATSGDKDALVLGIESTAKSAQGLADYVKRESDRHTCPVVIGPALGVGMLCSVSLSEVMTRPPMRHASDEAVRRP